MAAPYVRTALVAFFAAAGIAGCAGGASTPSPLAGTTTQQVTSASQSFAQARIRNLGSIVSGPLARTSGDHRGSWMAPGAKTMSKLLYVADEAPGNVDVYAYPKGTLEGTLTGFSSPSGICTDKAGNVYILNGNGTTIDVFAHGGTQPIRTLNLPGAPWFNCSVDQKTGNLALGTFDDSCGSCGGVIAIYANGSGTPTTYNPPNQTGLPGCAYDDAGNLFCNAFSTGGQSFALFELPRGSTTLTSIAITNSSLLAGAMQWDGKYLAFANGSHGTIEQLAVSGSTATLAGTTALDSTGWVWQFWIPGVPPKSKAQATRLIAPTVTSNDYVGYWNYPAGGSATKTITGLSEPDGATLSVVKS